MNGMRVVAAFVRLTITSHRSDYAGPYKVSRFICCDLVKCYKTRSVEVCRTCRVPSSVHRSHGPRAMMIYSNDAESSTTIAPADQNVLFRPTAAPVNC
jgi:hypothetical protein